MCSVAAIVCGIGLIKSYSRGAWLATLIGLAYLLHSALRTRPSILHPPSSILDPESPPLVTRHPSPVIQTAVILVSLAVLSFWQFRFTEWTPARRVFSVANINDFSWRNRVTAWNGALRMMADQPWFGHGWGQAEAVYAKKYLPANSESGVAIQMNDYFMLGISAGVPALLCFLIYVALSLRSPQSTVHSPQLASTLDPPPSSLPPTLNLEPGTLNWTRATCRAGAIVLLVGFWFDGGLFKLATGSVFWILLELGRVDDGRARHPVTTKPGEDGSVRAVSQEPTDLKEQSTPALSSPLGSQISNLKSPTSPVTRRPSPQWLRRTAWITATMALALSLLCLVTPFFPTNNLTLAIARHWLVPPNAVPDLNFLATLDPRPSTLHVLVQHASLANYNRQLINWKLDDDIYREYVLSPIINSQLSTAAPWHRRPLWEYFYPPIRHETDPQSAAQIVLKYLRDRVTVGSSSLDPRPSTLDEMWRQQKAAPEGFEALTVAAFRSVGIPARLNVTGHAEIFANGKWQAP